MKNLHLVGILLMATTLAIITGCKQDDPPKGGDKNTKKDGDKTKKDDHDHDGPGPHGGTIIEGFGKWHGEFKVDHKKQEATVYILGEDAKTAAPLQVEKLLLSIKTPQFQVDLKPVPQEGDPVGKSSRFVGKHEHFGKEQEFEGLFSGVVDGTPYTSDDFKEKPESPKKDKK